MTGRRRLKQTLSLEVRLADEAKQLRERAELLPAGAKRDKLVHKAQQAEVGAHMSALLRSPALKK